MRKKKYAMVGIGGRARTFYEALVTKYTETCELTAFCDLSLTRMNYANKIIQEISSLPPVPTYLHLEFEKMIDETKPDTVIVTSTDRTHHDFIIQALEKGCDVISEKPLTIDDRKARAIMDAQKRTGKNVRVTFNCRYMPISTKVRELIMNDTIGEVFSVHFEWLLNTSHGADYYRRWHRNKLNSGGLLVHKSTHHFDLVNFWLGARPETVFAFGDLNFYGRHNAEKRGETRFYHRAYGSEAAKGDYFALDMESNETLKSLYLDAEADSGYVRDRSVFSDDISIEDTMGVIVRYNSGTIMTYSLNSYMPWEGFNVNLNGSKGRIECKVAENVYVNAAGNPGEEGVHKGAQIIVQPLFGPPYEATFEEKEGGHGGGDNVMLDDIYLANRQMTLSIVWQV